MSNYKKKSRKSKHEVRDVDVEDTENTILQSSDEEELLITFPEPQLETENVEPSQQENHLDPPPNLDHTYARPNRSFTSSSLTTPSSSGIHLSVKVEVEEFDESIFNEIPSSVSELVSKNDKHNPIHAFEVSLEKIFKISDHISCSTPNLADKILNIDIKNIWGRALKPNDEYEPYDDLIQQAFNKWNHSLTSGRLMQDGDTPLFYQCYICKLAWWYFTPFKEHIRTHNLNTMKIQYQEDGFESYIYACEGDIRNTMYIPLEGNCPRCEKSYSFHVKPTHGIYSCKECFLGLETCKLLKQHESECLVTYFVTKCENEMYNVNVKCTICTLKFHTDSELESHMITVHDVRSDIISPYVFKTCGVCKKKYHYFFTHMCVRSTLSSPCEFCFRRFHTKTLHKAHNFIQEKDYPCRICGAVLQSRCMETEHMLRHTDNYRIVYRCINHTCPPTILFLDMESVKRHWRLYHKKKTDCRRPCYDKIVIPKQCVISDCVQILDRTGCIDGIRIEKVVSEEPEVEDWCVDNAPLEPMDTQPEIDDDVIMIKPEPQEPIVIDSQDDSMDSQMDYAEMLSKVFKVSDAVRNQRLSSLEDMQTQIKVETNDFDNADNMKEVLTTTIKQEPIDNTSTEPIDNRADIKAQTESENEHETSSFQIDNSLYPSQSESSRNDKESKCEVEISGGSNIKTEPEDYEIDIVYNEGIVAINVEPRDIKKEILEITEANKNVGDKVVPVKANLRKKKVINKKKLKRNAKSLLKHDVTELKITAKNSKSLLKKIIVKKENADIKMNDLNAECNSKTSEVKSGSKKKLCGENKVRKIKSLKFDENGVKIKRMYKCAKCGYEQSHKLFRMHQKSCCEYCPSEERLKDKRYDCTKCGRNFDSLKSYLVHFTKHGYGVLDCPSCNMKFEMLKDLIPHFQQHVKQNYVNCWLINDGKETTKKQHRCQLCRLIVRPHEFFVHWETHFQLRVEKNEPEELELSDVTETVSNKKELPPTVLHLALQQLRSAAREKVCVVCCRRFERRFDMKRHLVEHLLMDAYTKKDKLRAFTLRCQICVKEFQHKERYKYHMREHGGMPDYHCEICNKSFSDSSNFAKHKKIHNMGVVICDICKKKFQAKYSLEKHMVIHLTTEPIECNHCDRKFYSRSLYNKHILNNRRGVHMRCVQCDLTFCSSREKWDHAWHVHNNRKHKADCPICHQEFRKYQDVRNHARDEHKMDLSFYMIKSEAGVVNNVKFVQIKKHKKKK